jgi:hypothetical protein
MDTETLSEIDLNLWYAIEHLDKALSLFPQHDPRRETLQGVHDRLHPICSAVSDTLAVAVAAEKKRVYFSFHSH